MPMPATSQPCRSQIATICHCQHLGISALNTSPRPRSRHVLIVIRPFALTACEGTGKRTLWGTFYRT